MGLDVELVQDVYTEEEVAGIQVSFDLLDNLLWRQVVRQDNVFDHSWRDILEA